MKHKDLSVRRQCTLLSLNRAGLYYEKQPEKALNLTLMKRIDELYTAMPFYGIRRMTAQLKREGYSVNPKRIHRLMGLMGIQALYPKPNTSRKNPKHPIYPYLLKNLAIKQPNQVWATDITYLPMAHGFVYLVAIMDWHSRYVLSHRVSNSLDTQFCLEALEEALSKYPAPQILNTDQGCQFTSEAWTGCLSTAGIQISMDGRGRYLDNIFVERLWRTVKYEHLYLTRYETVQEVKEGLKGYFQQYNHDRLHQSLGYKTPAEVYHPVDCVEKPFKSLRLTPATFKQLSNTTSYDDEVNNLDRLRA